MATLHVVRQGAEPRTIVFLHGLRGDPFKTWMGSSGFSWPDHAGSQTPCTVLSIGYPATIVQGDMSILARAGHLLELLKVQPGVVDSSIVLVAHSLGGLIAKQMVRHAEENRRDHAWFLNQLVGMVFVATPHSGSDLASYATALGTVIKLGFSIQDLQKDSDALLDLNRWFRDRVEDLGIRVLSFYERRPVKLGWMRNIMVVHPSSADPGIRHVRPIALDDDHLSIAKPMSAQALQVLRTQSFLQQVFEFAPHLARLHRQAAAVCYRLAQDGEAQFLLVRTDGGRWTFPKGNIKVHKGESVSQAAAREAEEEAGVTGEPAPQPLRTYLHLKVFQENKPLDAPDAAEQMAVTAFLLHVTKQGKPRDKKRHPEWFSATDAVLRLGERRTPKYAMELEQVVHTACAALGASPPQPSKP